MQMETNSAAETSVAGTSANEIELSLLERIVQEGNMAVEPSQGVYAKKLIGQLASQILDEGMRTSPDKSVVAMINERVTEIDGMLTDQLNAIMPEPAFQALA